MSPAFEDHTLSPEAAAQMKAMLDDPNCPRHAGKEMPTAGPEVVRFAWRHPDDVAWIAAAVEVLKEVACAGSGGWCPVCDGEEGLHEPDCELHKLLSTIPQP